MNVLKFLKPLNLVFFLPLTFPLYLWKFKLFGIPFNFLEFVVLVLFTIQFFLWIFLFFKNNNRLSRLREFLIDNKKLLIFSICFFLCILFSILIVPREVLLVDHSTIFPSLNTALGIFKGWFLMPFLYFILLYFSERKQSSFLTSLYCYVLSALPLIIWAYYQSITGDYLTLDQRASGPFENANYLAMYIAPAITALWILLIQRIILKFKLIPFFIAVFFSIFYSIAILLTHSYGAILAIFFTLLVYLILNLLLFRRAKLDFEYQSLKRIGYFLIIILILIGFAGILIFSGTAKWDSFFDLSKRDSSTVRLQIYQIDLALIRESPILGIGLGQYQPQYDLNAQQILGQKPYELNMLHPHNTLMALWLNLGLAGLLLYLILIYQSVKSFYRSDEIGNKLFKLIGLMMFLMTFIHGLVDTYIFKNDLAFLFVLMLAICLFPNAKRDLDLSGEKHTI